MRRAALGLVGLALLVHLAASRCASNKDHPTVQVTKDPAQVKPCIDLARVTTDLEGSAGASDLRQKTADLGGNVLLVYNSRSGGAFYCEKPLPPDLGMPLPGQGMNPTPRHP